MKCVLLDAGHGGRQTGAQAGNVFEKDVVLAITLETEKNLRKRYPESELSIVLTRIGDKALSIQGRCDAIMNHKPNAFVSFHCNAIADNPATSYDDRKYAKGFEVFYRDKYDLPLARAIHNVVRRSELWGDRGIKLDVEWLGKHLGVLNNMETPAVLLEMGFITNEHDRIIMVNNQKAIGELIAHGISDFVFPEAETTNG